MARAPPSGQQPISCVPCGTPGCAGVPWSKGQQGPAGLWAGTLQPQGGRDPVPGGQSERPSAELVSTLSSAFGNVRTVKTPTTLSLCSSLQGEPGELGPPGPPVYSPYPSLIKGLWEQLPVRTCFCRGQQELRDRFFKAKLGCSQHARGGRDRDTPPWWFGRVGRGHDLEGSAAAPALPQEFSLLRTCPGPGLAPRVPPRHRTPSLMEPWGCLSPSVGHKVPQI